MWDVAGKKCGGGEGNKDFEGDMLLLVRKSKCSQGWIVRIPAFSFIQVNSKISEF